MLFPGLDSFTVTAPIAYAIFVLREASPADCTSMTVELSEMGAAIVTASRPDGTTVDVDLSEDAMSAAGMLLTSISYQVMSLTSVLQPYGDDAVLAAQSQLAASLAEVGLRAGLLGPDLADAITITR